MGGKGKTTSFLEPRSEKGERTAPAEPEGRRKKGGDPSLLRSGEERKGEKGLLVGTNEGEGERERARRQAVQPREEKGRASHEEGEGNDKNRSLTDPGGRGERRGKVYDFRLTKPLEEKERIQAFRLSDKLAQKKRRRGGTCRLLLKTEGRKRKHDWLVSSLQEKGGKKSRKSR